MIALNTEHWILNLGKLLYVLCKLLRSKVLSCLRHWVLKVSWWSARWLRSGAGGPATSTCFRTSTRQSFGDYQLECHDLPTKYKVLDFHFRWEGSSNPRSFFACIIVGLCCGHFPIVRCELYVWSRIPQHLCRWPGRGRIKGHMAFCGERRWWNSEVAKIT